VADALTLLIKSSPIMLRTRELPTNTISKSASTGERPANRNAVGKLFELCPEYVKNDPVIHVQLDTGLIY
jgi:hypothetical protein